MYSQVVVVVLMFFLGSDASVPSLFTGMGTGTSSGYDACTSLYRPCRTRIVMRYLNGTYFQSIGTQTCACQGSASCSDDWSLNSHVVSRNLISTDFNMTLDMMFCESVAPQRTCLRHENALELQGSMIVTTRLASMNCQCSDNRPLRLRRSWYGEDHQKHQTFICAEHRETCPSGRSQCLVSTPEMVYYHCDCDSRSYCRIETPRGSQTAFGFCRRRHRRSH